MHKNNFEGLRFDGDDYVPERDDVRLTGQIKRVFDLMSDGKERTLDGISARTGYPSASISAQLRHLRKPRFGGHTVHKRYGNNGLYFYRLEVNKK
jgi:hypothetical protein